MLPNHPCENFKVPESNKSDNVNWKNQAEYMECKRSKLSAQLQNEAVQIDGYSSIFKGVSICVNGYTEPTAAELKRIILNHGGEYHVSKTGKTTHTLATNLAFAKMQKLSDSVKIMHPNWIVDSLKAGRLLAEETYRLYQSSVDKVSSNDYKAKRADSIGKAKCSVARTTDENFLKEFYGRSRLHFISTLAEEQKDKVRQMILKKEDKSKAREQLRSVLSQGRVSTSNQIHYDESDSFIAHFDIDCFFVSVSLQKYPQLCNQPVVVAHSKGLRKTEGASSWSEIASCSYEARRCGIKNGMMLGQALKLCANLHSIPYDFDRCKEVSNVFFSTILKYTDKVQAISCDEIYVDLSELCYSIQASPTEVVAEIRREIFDLTQCTISAGIGPNKLIARLATKVAKPNGQLVIVPSGAGEFVKEIAISDLPGVGRSYLNKLNRMGIVACTDLRSADRKMLVKNFGPKIARSLRNKAFGIDNSPVQMDALRKSLSCDVNYGVRMKDTFEALEFLNKLSVELSSRMRASSLRGRNFTLKLMIRAPGASVKTSKFLGHGICDTVSKSITAADYTDAKDVILKIVESMYRSINPVASDVRGVGISVHKLIGHNSTLPKKVSFVDMKKFLFTKTPTLPSDQPHISSANNHLEDGVDRFLYNDQKSELSSKNRTKEKQRTIDKKRRKEKLMTQCKEFFESRSGIKQGISLSSDSPQCVQQPSHNLSLMEKLQSRTLSYEQMSDGLEPADDGDFDQAKYLITSWSKLESGSRVPPSSEILQISLYVVDLINKGYLQEVQRLMAYTIYAESKNSALKPCVEEIDSTIQKTMMNLYGCQMALGK